MEDNKINLVKSLKYLGIILIIIFIVIVIILIKNNDKNAIEKKLKENGYKMLVNNIYSKSIENETEKINYSYKIKIDEFSKSIMSQTTNVKENTILTYDNGLIKIDYNYQNTDGCMLSQTATYQKDAFTCNIMNKRGTCKARCDVILETIKEFKDEIKEINPNLN